MNNKVYSLNIALNRQISKNVEDHKELYGDTVLSHT